MCRLGYQSFLILVRSGSYELTCSILSSVIGIVEFSGSTVVDCPPSLHSGASLIVSLSIYLKASAFKPPNAPLGDETPRHLFNEGHETADEQTLRERKSSLIHLFDILNLKPTNRMSAVKRKRKVLSQEELKLLTQKAAKSKKGSHMEIVGDGEEIMVEGDEEELSENQLNLIYRKCAATNEVDIQCYADQLHRAQQNDTTMEEMEPADTFTLTLRSYQKQALRYVQSSSYPDACISCST